MSQFLYFYPGYLPDDLGSIGLGHVGKSYAKSNPSIPGPGDQSGILFQIGGTPQTLRYTPDQQTWKQAPGQRWWVGFWNDARPHPGSLRLKGALDGKPVELLDGNRWEIIPARRYSGFEPVCALPQVMTLNDQRKWVRGKVVQRYRAYWELANKVAPLFWDFEGDREQANEVAFDAAVTALSIGYRIGSVEVDLLELFDERAAGQVLYAMLDFEGWKDAAKNLISHSGQVASSGLSGVEVLTQETQTATDQRSAN